MPSRTESPTSHAAGAQHSNGARRTLRTTALLLGIVSIVCGASAFIYRSALEALEERAASELDRAADACGATVEATLDDMGAQVEDLAGREQMVSILDGDLDNEILRALQNSLARSSFTKLACLDATGRVVASTEHAEFDQVLEVPETVRDSLESGHTVDVRTGGGGFTLTAPVVWKFDELETIGFVRAEARLEALLAGTHVSIARLIDEHGEVLAEDTLPVRPGELPRPWWDTALRKRAVRLEVRPGLADPGWTVAIASDAPEVIVEAGVLRRMAMLLTSATAGLVSLLVLAFAAAEARLGRRLAARTLELEAANVSLDRSRSDLVKAARIAGMSEVATGILHNVGNALNSLVVAAQQAGAALAGSNVSDLRRMVDFLDEDRDGFTTRLREHERGGPFLEYLSQLTAGIEADSGRATDEIECVRTSVDHITTLVHSHQEYATRSSVQERTQLADVMDGALVISDQALGDLGEARVVREYADLPDVLLYKHRVIEILVHLINNARQAALHEGVAQPRITLRVGSTANGRVRYEVEDNGVGIAEGDMARIFNHGFSTRDGGNGFGLHAASNAATELGGTLDVESRGPGCGAKFSVELPYESVSGSEVQLARAS